MRIAFWSFLLILALAMFLPVGHSQAADRLEITLDIRPDMSVDQTNKFYFSTLLAAGKVNYTVDGRVRDIKILDDKQELDYTFNNNLIDITLKGPTKTLTITYIADNVIFHSDSVSHFFAEFSFENTIKNMTVEVKLPPGFAIYKNEYRPSSANVVSDGQRIILVWKLNSIKDVLFSVKFSSPDQENNIAGIVAAMLVVVAILIYLHFRKRTREEFLKGFREDEKRTIEYLEQKKVAFQSDLQKEFKFSRAKSTRIVMHLEQKGLVRKQKYGRTNRLYWLKK